MAPQKCSLQCDLMNWDLQPRPHMQPLPVHRACPVCPNISPETPDDAFSQRISHSCARPAQDISILADTPLLRQCQHTSFSLQPVSSLGPSQATLAIVWRAQQLHLHRHLHPHHPTQCSCRRLSSPFARYPPIWPRD